MNTVSVAATLVSLIMVSIILDTALASEEVNKGEILGFKLGMTVEEVEAHMKERFPDAQHVRHVHRYFTYRAAGVDKRTESFPSGINFSYANRTSSIHLLFSPPPAGGRLAGIVRTQMFGPQEGPTRENLRSALVQRYGEPSEEKAEFGSLKLLWEFPDDFVRCIPVVGASPRIELNTRPPLLRYFDSVGQQDPSVCKSYLSASLGGRSGERVSGVGFLALDISHIGLTELASDKWIAELEAQEREVAEETEVDLQY